MRADWQSASPTERATHAERMRYRVLRIRPALLCDAGTDASTPCPTASTTMSTRRAVIAGAAGLLWARAVPARLPAEATESSLRDAIRRHVEAWNRHDVPAWGDTLTEDVRYTEGVTPYRTIEGRSAVVSQLAERVRTTNLAWDIVRVRMRSDSSATVVVRQVAALLPKVDGRHARTVESAPSVSRWRYEGGWKMWFFSAHKASALAAMKEDGVE
jgi:hypothetical protein